MDQRARSRLEPRLPSSPLRLSPLRRIPFPSPNRRRTMLRRQNHPPSPSTLCLLPRLRRHSPDSESRLRLRRRTEIVGWRIIRRRVPLRQPRSQRRRRSLSAHQQQRQRRMDSVERVRRLVDLEEWTKDPNRCCRRIRSERQLLGRPRRSEDLDPLRRRPLSRQQQEEHSRSDRRLPLRRRRRRSPSVRLRLQTIRSVRRIRPPGPLRPSSRRSSSALPFPRSTSLGRALRQDRRHRSVRRIPLPSVLPRRLVHLRTRRRCLEDNPLNRLHRSGILPSPSALRRPLPSRRCSAHRVSPRRLRLEDSDQLPLPRPAPDSRSERRPALQQRYRTLWVERRRRRVLRLEARCLIWGVEEIRVRRRDRGGRLRG